MTASIPPPEGISAPSDRKKFTVIAAEARQLHHCPEVMNPPQSAARGCEAGNLNTGDVMGMGPVHRAAEARPAEAVPPPLTEAQLELAIAAAMQRLCKAPERAEKMRHWREMVRLIDQRTPHRRRFMERMRGIA